MRVVDTIISREGGNSVWANVVFVGDRGESVSVRLPYPVPSGGDVGRARIADRAMELLEGIVSHKTAKGAAQRQRGGTERFGKSSDTTNGSNQKDE